MNTSLLSGAEVSEYGEPERETPDWPVRIGTAVVFLGCVYCALRAAGAF